MPRYRAMQKNPRSKATIKQLIGDGRRVTAQRALLLEMLRQQEGHLDADELYRLAREKNPHISLSTVYRTLRLFKKMGLVEELHFEEEHHHYEGKPHREHFHLICLKCGRIIEFESNRIAQLKQEMGKKEDFEIQGAEVHLTGYCSQCRRKTGSEGSPAKLAEASRK